MTRTRSHAAASLANRVPNSHRVAHLLLLALSVMLLGGSSAHAKDLQIVKPAMECAALTKMVLTNPEAPGRVESAVIKESEAPPPAMIAKLLSLTAVEAHPFCDVKGYVTPQVHFEIHLPIENWTQRLMFQGCGGFCGAVAPFGFYVMGGEGCQPATHGEIAVVTSDLGHSSQMMDAVWAASKQAREDFGYRGVHVSTLAAKEIVARYYGQPQTYSYFNGCSDGGREAMVSVERYPADFNGVIAGAPVFNEVANNTIYHAWGVQKLIRADGSLVFSDAALKTLHNAALEACDTLGGDPKDGVIPDPTKCHFDPATAACKAGASGDSCLSPEQVQAAKELYIGPHDVEGHALYYGYDYGSEMSWNKEAQGDGAWGKGSFPGYLASDPPDPNAEFKTQTFTREAVRKNNAFADELDALNSDLRPLHKAGAKLIIWHGWGDIGVAPGPTLAFYQAAREKVGPEFNDFVRLYMLPGVAHCGGGEGPDKMKLMAAIMAWVEDGVAPGPMTAVKKDETGKVIAERVIQPYK
jgi:Tannase and feruloyl esterase